VLGAPAAGVAPGGLQVARAEREGCELVTDNLKLIASLGPQFAFVVPLASLP